MTGRDRGDGLRDSRDAVLAGDGDGGEVSVAPPAAGDGGLAAGKAPGPAAPTPPGHPGQGRHRHRGEVDSQHILIYLK